MTRPDRPRWGLWNTPDVLIDAVVLAVIAYCAHVRYDRMDYIGCGLLTAAGTFLFGLSLLVRGCIVPELHDRRMLRAARERLRERRQGHR